MKYYFNEQNNRIYAYEDDGSQDNIIPSTYVPATPEQISAIINPPVSPNDAIKLQILEIEKTITVRRLSEAAISDEGKAWLTDVQGKIALLRSQLV